MVTVEPSTATLSDEHYMEIALQLAERGRGRTSPNPLVGALIVTADGVIVGRGFHERAGEPHAEIRALLQAGSRASGATLYSTLEPCCHTGRTGPCTEAIIEARVRRVVAATADPNPLVASHGFDVLRGRGIRVDVGVAAAHARRLNQAFFASMRLGRPLVTLKLATSLDGKITARPGVRTDLTSDEAQERVHALRAEVDAIAVGSTTVLVDDPLLTARGIFRERPLARVVFDTRLRTPPDARLFSTLSQGPLILVTVAETLDRDAAQALALRQAGAELLVVPAFEQHVDLARTMRDLASRGIRSLLLEGGAQIADSASKADLIDRFHIYISPQILGPDGVPWLPHLHTVLATLHDRQVTPVGPDVCIEGNVHRLD